MAACLRQAVLCIDTDTSQWQQLRTETVFAVPAGEWEPPVIPNPEYKGEWKPNMIDNTAYKGIWTAPDIPNPAYVHDDTLYNYKDLKYVGFELWQVKSGSIFDNIIVTDNIDEAFELAKATWEKTKDAEKEMMEKVGGWTGLLL